MDILQMIYKDKDLVTPTRSSKPISQVAENVTVIDAEEIEAINAHTLTDVLLHVTGVQMDIQGGPGSFTNALIQGSDPRHVRVMVDGVTLNNIGDNLAEIGSFPVQQIERIEIIKGPASSTWGSSLGGIINIITKSPDPDRRLGGFASTSIGERTTADLRTELSGTVGSLGYYIYGGGITSDGLTTNTPFDGGNLYAKLQWQAAKQVRLQCSLFYDKGVRGEGQFTFPPAVSFGRNMERFFSTLSLSYDLTDELSLDISGRFIKKRNSQSESLTSSGAEIASVSTDDQNAGVSAKLAWRSGMSSLLTGFDYDYGVLESGDILDGKQNQVRWAVFANDTLSISDLSITPGLRYDNTSTNGDFVSPSLGLTYTLFEKTILRAYVARGFNTPPLGFTFAIGGNPDLKPEKVWSYSVGVETPISGYLWFKVTGFRHDIQDVIDQNTLLNAGKQRRQGVETELRTVPFFHTSLMAGFTFIDITDPETHQVIKDLPRYTCDMGIDYNDNDTLRGALRGHYISWNASADADARYTAMIWDLNLAKKFVERDGRALEVFFTAHNIFNGAQYLNVVFQNPRRWFEGGLRFKF
jgi:vitamin B12 transporter